MRYLSVCSGIEAATQAWHPLGWQAAAFSDIEAFPRAVLRYHYPDVPLHGRDRAAGESLEDYADAAGFQTIKGDDYGPVDLLVGGTPCQSFSVAGLRGGLDDQRGNLALEYVRLAERLGARRIIWENVPGVFSTDGGEAFRRILSALARADVAIPPGGWQNAGIVAPGISGYGLAWRVFDAQYVRSDGHWRAAPQRRRRVFLVGYLGDWRRAAAVLFEPQSLRGDSPPRRDTRQGIACGVAPSLTASGRGVERTGETRGQDPVVAVPSADPAFTLPARECKGPLPERDLSTVICEVPVGFNARQDTGTTGEISGPLDSGRAAQAWRVRRLTPVECERLQRFPDNFTRIPYRGKPAIKCPDGPRYKALGNSMAVNAMAWIGQRIDLLDRLEQEGRL